MDEKEIFEEVSRMLIDSDNGNDIVLIRDEVKNILGYILIRKSSFSFMIIEDTELAKEFIKALLSRNVDVCDSIKEAKERFNLTSPKPMFWPKDKPWPPR